MKCPICKGKGQLYTPKSREPDKKVMVILLDREGYSIRQIMRFVGYKSPRSVWKIINRK